MLAGAKNLLIASWKKLQKFCSDSPQCPPWELRSNHLEPSCCSLDWLMSDLKGRHVALKSRSLRWTKPLSHEIEGRCLANFQRIFSAVLVVSPIILTEKRKSQLTRYFFRQISGWHTFFYVLVDDELAHVWMNSKNVAAIDLSIRSFPGNHSMDSIPSFTILLFCRKW